MIKILIVDDDEDICLTLKQILEKDGFEVRIAGNGWRALEIINEESFDVVLVDLLLPGMDGIELLREIKKIYPSTVVIILTAYGSIASAVEAIKRGASDYICKPFRLGDLITTIKKSLAEIQIKNLNEQIFSCLSHKIRRQILIYLAEKRRLKFSELAKILQIEDPPRLNFHLKILKRVGYIAQDEERRYYITPLGIEALKLLRYKSEV